MAEVTQVAVSAEDVAKPEEVTQVVTEVTPEVPPTEAPAVTPVVNTPADVVVDLDSAANEFITSGELSEATVAALQEKGFTQEQATIYATGIKAQADQVAAKLAERVGGKDALTSMMQWAQTGGMTDTERSAYDSMVTSGNEAQVHLALDGLSARYTRALGNVPNKVNGTSVPTESAPKAFASSAEVVAAMRDPRYGTDPAYRASVAARLAESDSIGIRR